jgi:hypothetical protein
MEKVEETKPATRSARDRLIALIVVLACLVVAVTGVCAVRYFANRSRLEKSFGSITKTYPTLVLGRVKFSKYLAQGTLPSADPHFSYLDVYLVRGTADIQFDLSNVEVDSRRTNYLNRVLVLRYVGREKFLVDMDIYIDPGDITLAETIRPEAYSKEELDKARQVAAVPAGAIGAYIGSKAGSFAGSSGPLMKYSGGFGSILGSAAGALTGAAAGAGAAYAFTENLMTAFQPSTGSRPSVMELIAAAKPMIGMELAGGDRLRSEAWADETRRYYRDEFCSRLGAIAKTFGWKKVIVDFGGQQ